ncbi:hypothetical protein TrVE_jg8040 [Triparma verrucosa]|uniref:Uncharacterized protein n=1 Tax=Triparma verrucosa TaxID=1606542 RepID=A0A9W7F4L5_9STRA|nr:hypothetical protein TrVE_jg8040 [Triparma verrucosa]
MHTDDFRRLFVGFVMVDTLVAMRWLDGKWHKVVEKKLTEFEDEPFGEIIVHGGNDISLDDFCLEQVDLLHTHAQELGENVFADCKSLTEMRVPDSLQEFGEHVFWKCSKLVPSDIDVDGDSEASDDEGVTSEIVAYLRSKQ